MIFDLPVDHTEQVVNESPKETIYMTCLKSKNMIDSTLNSGASFFLTDKKFTSVNETPKNSPTPAPFKRAMFAMSSKAIVNALNK